MYITLECSSIPFKIGINVNLKAPFFISPFFEERGQRKIERETNTAKIKIENFRGYPISSTFIQVYFSVHKIYFFVT